MSRWPIHTISSSLGSFVACFLREVSGAAVPVPLTTLPPPRIPLHRRRRLCPRPHFPAGVGFRYVRRLRLLVQEGNCSLRRLRLPVQSSTKIDAAPSTDSASRLYATPSPSNPTTRILERMISCIAADHTPQLGSINGTCSRHMATPSKITDAQGQF